MVFSSRLEWGLSHVKILPLNGAFEAIVNVTLRLPAKRMVMIT